MDAESQERYRLMVEHANELILVAQDGVIRFANPKVTETLGYSQEEITSRPFVEFIHSEDRQMVLERHLRRLRGEELPHVYPFRVVAKDGTVKWMEINAVAIVWDGRPATLNFLSEITARRQAEEALIQSEQRYRSLVENTLEGFFVFEVPTGRFLFLNQRICELFGYTKEEGLGLTVWQVISPEDHYRIRERIRARMEGRPLDRGPHVYQAVRKDGSTFRAEATGSLVTYEGRVAMQGLLRDVTEQERLQRQLQHAQKMQAVGTLAGGVAHEFNNILAAIQGYAQLISFGTEADHPWAPYLREIALSCQRGAALTRKMLAFSRVEVGERQPVNVNQVVEWVQRFLRQAMPPTVELELSLQQDVPSVMGDSPQLEQLLVNLALNARDAMPRGGKIQFVTRVTDLDEAFLLSHPWATNGRFVEIQVNDNGEGMSPEILDRVFEPFFTTKEPGKGTGLGLAIAYSIVKAHGGYIAAESPGVMGVGSSFRVYLPPASQEGKEVAEAEPPPPGGRGESILVVDDEPQLLEIVREVLEYRGYRVSVASHGEDALRLYRRGMAEEDRFQLVILDLAMPVMDGAECLDRLLEMDPKARVLISTGHIDVPYPLELLRAKVKGLLKKPFKMESLLREVRLAIDEL